MASQIRESFKPWSPENDTEMGSPEFISTQGSSVQSGEDISNSPIAQLGFLPKDNGSCAKRELQTLWERFTTWLQPEKHSKEQMISKLVLAQFLITGHCKDKFALKEKWESSGRNMGRFMDGLTDECLKPPVMVHVSMQGQEALFSESMTLKEVIKLLKEQQSATTTTQENAGTPLPTPQDMLLAAGYENSEDGQNTFLSDPEVNSAVSSPRHEMDSLLIIQTGQYAEPEEGGVSYGVLQHSRRASQGTSRYQAEALGAPYEHIPMEIQAVSLSRTDQPEDNEDGHNTFFKTTDVNSGISNLKSERDSLLIIQSGQYPEPQEGGVSYGVLWDARRAIWGISRPQKVSPTPHSSEDNPLEVPGFLSRPEQRTSEPVLLCQSNQANSVCEGHQEILNRDLKPYKCEECSRSFKYSCNFSVHQKKHRKERPFVSSTHHPKGFYQGPELQVHEVIHEPEKPFPCGTCGRSFSHKTNLQAHERIHTGEKPYTCFLCNSRFRQSSTYHRHLRNYHKHD